jgi:hypothetical protein
VYSPKLIVLSTLLLGSVASADCIPFSDAAKHVGSRKCVTGKIAKVTRLASGTTFLNFCEDYRTCPFQVVVFRGDLRHVGDVRQLEGQMIEINGDIREYDRHAEIILRNASQLRGASGKIPPLPKDFDVEKKGRFSAGKFSHPKSRSKQPKPSRQPAPIQTEEPESQ